MKLALPMALVLAQPALAADTLTGTYKGQAKYLTTNTKCINQTITLKITFRCGRLIKGTVTAGGNTIKIVGTAQSNYINMSGASDDMNIYAYVAGIQDPSTGNIEQAYYSQETMNEIDRVYDQPISFVKQ